MAILEVKNLVKEFPVRGKSQANGRVLNGINFSVRRGEFVTILGPNGCGKTTLLKMIAGFEEPTSGSISFQKRSEGLQKAYLVLQNPDESLFNWLSVLENVRIGNCSGETSDSAASSILESIRVAGTSLSEFSNHYPYQLSGGLKQLAVIARAIAFNPSIMLLDEPFSSLDVFTKTEIEDALLELYEKNRVTTLFVSHELESAIYLADRIVLLSGRPAEVKKIIEVKLPRPRNRGMKNCKAFRAIKLELEKSMGKKP